MDATDPFLRRNLSRLEARFRARYYSSVQKDVKRRKKGKPSHKSTLKSIAENLQRFQEVQKIRNKLFGNEQKNQGENREAQHQLLKSVKVFQLEA